MGQRLVVLLNGFPTRYIRHAIAPILRVLRMKQPLGTMECMKICSPEQMTLVDMVSEKYAVIQDFATWKMSVPGRAFAINVLVTHATA
jgi:hypothetical protein